MSLLAVAALLIVAYFLAESGLTFIAAIVFLLAVLQALSNRSEAAAPPGIPAGAGQRPVIVTTSGGEIPKTVKVVVKNPWPGTDLYEDFQTYLGGVVEWPIRILLRIFTGKIGKKKSAMHYKFGDNPSH